MNGMTSRKLPNIQNKHLQGDPADWNPLIQHQFWRKWTWFTPHKTGVLTTMNRDTSSREDCLEIYTLIHHQLQSLICRGYKAWMVGCLTLTTAHGIGCINTVSFPDKVKTAKW